MSTKLLTLVEVSDLIRVPVSTLRYWRQRGDGGPPTFRVGRRVMARESEVLAWLLEQQRSEQDDQ